MRRAAAPLVSLLLLAVAPAWSQPPAPSGASLQSARVQLYERLWLAGERDPGRVRDRMRAAGLGWWGDDAAAARPPRSVTPVPVRTTAGLPPVGAARWQAALADPGVIHGRGLTLPTNFPEVARAVNASPGAVRLRAAVLRQAVYPDEWEVDPAYLSPVQNQGPYGNCWSFATVALLEHLYWRLGYRIAASEQFIIDNNPDGYGCHGGLFAGEFCTRTGTAARAEYAYSGCGPTRSSAGPKYRFVSYAFVDPSGGLPPVSEIKDALMTHGVVAVAASADGSWDNYQGGDQVIVGGRNINHEVCIIGWSTRRNAWKVRNSWGPDWGNAGYCWVAYGAGQIGYAACYAAVVDPSPAPVPAPTPTPTPAPTPTPTPSPAPSPGSLTLVKVSPVWDTEGGVTRGYVVVDHAGPVVLKLTPPGQVFTPPATPEPVPQPVPALPPAPLPSPQTPPLRKAS